MIALQFRPIFGALQDLELRPFDAACTGTLWGQNRAMLLQRTRSSKKAGRAGLLTM
jgi:hypothetical protein